MFANRKDLVKGIAEERIKLLFDLANGAIGEDRALAHKYVKSMRSISLHYKVQLPKKISNGICTRCDEILVPGLNTSVRIVSSKGYIAYKCTTCGNEVHMYY